MQLGGRADFFMLLFGVVYRDLCDESNKGTASDFVQMSDIKGIVHK
jgi:hypothetical protein